MQPTGSDVSWGIENEDISNGPTLKVWPFSNGTKSASSIFMRHAVDSAVIMFAKSGTSANCLWNAASPHIWSS